MYKCAHYYFHICISYYSLTVNHCDMMIYDLKWLLCLIKHIFRVHIYIYTTIVTIYYAYM